ncbi:MAG: hypothetical protein ACYDAP_00320 [Thermoplasmataceae archaeon]
MSCPKGYYWDGSRCRKSITIKRRGIYGKGFESEPQTEQYAKIRKEARIEGAVKTERQMAALNAFAHNKGSAHKDLEYAKKIARKSGEEGRPPEFEGYTRIQCEEAGGIWIKAHRKTRGIRVSGYCRRR